MLTKLFASAEPAKYGGFLPVVKDDTGDTWWMGDKYEYEEDALHAANDKRERFIDNCD